MPTSRQGGGHPSPAAVSAVGLRMSYGDKTVLDGIDLRIPAGSLFALLGPNGAGKKPASNCSGGAVPSEPKETSRSRGPIRTGAVSVTESVNASEVTRCLGADAGTAGQNGQLIQGFGCAGSNNQLWQWADTPTDRRGVSAMDRRGPHVDPRTRTSIRRRACHVGKLEPHFPTWKI